MLEINIENIGYANKSILSDVNLLINKPGLYGFFGKNGAGKTTLFKAICGILPFKGTVSYNKKKISSPNIALVPTEPFVYEYLTIKEFYTFYQHTIGRKAIEHKVFDIEENKILKECSTGMRKKAYINTILQYNDYQLYIFDEPFNGLDIESNYIILNKILEISKHSIVFISSHIIEVIEQYLDEIFLISEGKIINFDRKESVKSYFLS